MLHVRAWLHSVAVEERAATAIEYALIAGAIALAIVAVLGAVGEDLNVLYDDIQNNVNDH